MNPKPFASLNHFTVPVDIADFLYWVFTGRTPGRRRVTMTKEGKCRFDSARRGRQGGDWNFTT
jgi:hypothetical protein